MGDLVGRVERIGGLSAATRSDMFALYVLYYGGASRDIFLGDLAEKQYAVILRDSAGQIQGFSSIKVWSEDFRGRPVRIIYSGDTVVHRDHWGQQELAFTWVHFSGALKSQEPDLPLYWFLLVKGHRTYRYLRAFYRQFYPAHNHPTPTETKALMDQLAAGRYGEFYRREDGVVHFPQSRGHLKPAWAQVPEKDLRRADVRFFLQRNPGYEEGDELVCLAELSCENHNPLIARLFTAGNEEGLESVLARGERTPGG